MSESDETRRFDNTENMRQIDNTENMLLIIEDSNKLFKGKKVDDAAKEIVHVIQNALRAGATEAQVLACLRAASIKSSANPNDNTLAGIGFELHKNARAQEILGADLASKVSAIMLELDHNPQRRKAAAAFVEATFANRHPDISRRMGVKGKLSRLMAKASIVGSRFSIGSVDGRFEGPIGLDPVTLEHTHS